jgi:hypothetical protein
VNERCESRDATGKYRCDLDSGHVGQHEGSLDVPGHNRLIDSMDIDAFPDQRNELHCECGQRLWPACDMSRGSINACFTEHQLAVSL